MENFLLFEKTVFTFGPGLNAVSGETGAGKSLLARALGLALGGRGGHDIIRSGCEEAGIVAVFKLGQNAPEAARTLADAKGEILLRRVIRKSRDGGGLTVNGKAATSQSVRNALAGLVDFAAQNEHTRIGDPAYQLELLDAFGKLAPLAEKYRCAYQAAESLARRLKAGREERELVRLRLDRAKKDLKDLDLAAFDPKADLDLEERIREMSNAAGIVQAAAEAAAHLEGDGESGALGALAAAWRGLEKMAALSPRLAEAEADLAAALERAEEGLGKLSALTQDVDADPARLDAMIGRSEKLKSLGKRFECEVAGLAAAREKLLRDIEDLSGWDADEGETRKRLAAALPGVIEAGVKLAERRREAAGRLEKAVNRELAELGMEQAGFLVDFEPLWRVGEEEARVLEAGAAGLDEVGFYLTPNPGEAPSAVSGGVSGGEASRAVLALKSALSAVYRPDVMFLDEVDAGVGARLGRELGMKLRGLAESRQVIVITHLPQIAAYAGQHLKVAKEVKGGRTKAWVESLQGEARSREVASMIHGRGAGEVTLRQAEEMLREGGNG